MNKLFMVLWEVRFLEGETSKILVPSGSDPVEWYREHPTQVSKVTFVEELEVLCDFEQPEQGTRFLAIAEYNNPADKRGGAIYTLMDNMVSFSLWLGNNFPTLFFKEMEIDFDIEAVALPM